MAKRRGYQAAIRGAAASLVPVADPDSLKRVVATGRPVVGTVRPAPEDADEPVFAIRGQ